MRRSSSWERKNLKGIALASAGLLVVFSLAFALADIRWSEPYKTLSVRLVQGGIAQDEKFSPMGSLTSFERYVRLMNEKPAPENGLIVLPETHFPDSAPTAEAGNLEEIYARY